MASLNLEDYEPTEAGFQQFMEVWSSTMEMSGPDFESFVDSIENPNGHETSIIDRIGNAFNKFGEEAASFFGTGEDSVFGQLAAGDIYGNQIWGDPGIYVNFQFDWGPVHGGFGFELIYDWGNDGTPGTGWNLYGYFDYGTHTITPNTRPWEWNWVPRPSGGLAAQSTYNFRPENYTEDFQNVQGSITHPVYGGPSLGFSTTPDGWREHNQGRPITDPYTYYGGWSWGGNSTPISVSISNQYYFHLF